MATSGKNTMTKRQAMIDRAYRKTKTEPGTRASSIGPFSETINSRGSISYTGGRNPIAEKAIQRSPAARDKVSKQAQKAMYAYSVRNGKPTENAMTNGGNVLPHAGKGSTVTPKPGRRINGPLNRKLDKQLDRFIVSPKKLTGKK